MPISPRPRIGRVVASHLTASPTGRLVVDEERRPDPVYASLSPRRSSALDATRRAQQHLQARLANDQRDHVPHLVQAHSGIEPPGPLEDHHSTSFSPTSLAQRARQAQLQLQAQQLARSQRELAESQARLEEQAQSGRQQVFSRPLESDRFGESAFASSLSPTQAQLQQQLANTQRELQQQKDQQERQQQLQQRQQQEQQREQEREQRQREQQQRQQQQLQQQQLQAQLAKAQKELQQQQQLQTQSMPARPLSSSYREDRPESNYASMAVGALQGQLVPQRQQMPVHQLAPQSVLNVPSVAHMVAVMSDEEFSLLREILDRAQSILQSSPSHDSSMSFLRILSAYDQILLRHDLAPNEDTQVFQWLVTLNIETDEEIRAANAQATGGRASTHSKTHETWMQKLNQLYQQGESARRARQAQPSPPPQRQQPPASYHPYHQSRELSLESLESGANSFAASSASPHVTFASSYDQHGHSQARRSSRGQPLREDDLSDEKDRAFDEKHQQSPRSARSSRSRSRSRERDANSSLDDSSDQVFMDLVKSSRGRKGDPSPKGRLRVTQCFEVWRKRCSRRHAFVKRVGERHELRARDEARECFRIWKQGLVVHRYKRYLTSLHRNYSNGVVRNLLTFWCHEVRRRRSFERKQQETHTGEAFAIWRREYAASRHRRQLMFTAERAERLLKWKYSLMTWRRFTKIRKRQKARGQRLDAFVDNKIVSRAWPEWRKLIKDNAIYVKQARRHLLRLREHQCLLHWISSTRLLHQPQHRAMLTVQQFHILWRWCSRSFGRGYDVMRVIKLAKMKYQPAATEEEERERWRTQGKDLPNPHTHPFIAGPPSATSFAATAAALFAPYASYSAHLAQSMPTGPSLDGVSFSPDVTSPPPVLGSPVSSMDVAIPPYSDPSLPMKHGILALLNHSLTFRTHKLSQLMAMIQLWSRWYMRHLFTHWLANIRQQRAERDQEAKRLVERAEEQVEAERRVTAMRVKATLAMAFARWSDTYNKAAYYTQLLASFMRNRRRRLVTEQYVSWKFAFVGLKARKLFRLKRGLVAWRSNVTTSTRLKRKYGILRFTKRRNLLTEVWQHWCHARQCALATQRGQLGMLWHKWREAWRTSRQQAQEGRDADIYYGLKLVMKNLLMWRALAITQSIANKLAHKAVHHYHQQISHRGVVWWVNWKRYRTDSKRMAEYGRHFFLRKLASSAIKSWRENTTSKSYRHQQFKECRSTVRNRHLARAALRTWAYGLVYLRRVQRIRRTATMNMQSLVWTRWLASIQLKNQAYETLEMHVATRRDFNALGSLFTTWYATMLDARKASRLRDHCEMTWYYALIKRLFGRWRHVAHDVHREQMHQARLFHLQQLRTRGRRSCIEKWQKTVAHQASYHAIIAGTRDELATRHQAKRFYRLWREAFRRSRLCSHFLRIRHVRFVKLRAWRSWRSQSVEAAEHHGLVAGLVEKQGGHILRASFARWARSFVPHAQKRKRALKVVTDKLRLIYLRRVLVEWTAFKLESRLQVPAIRLHKRTTLGHLYAGWREVFAEARRAKRADAWAAAYDAKHTLARVYTSWKASIRAARIHDLFLYQKTLLGWKRYIRLQKEHKRIAFEFKENFHVRRMRFCFRLWIRYGKQFVAKGRRRLQDKQRRTIVANHQERVHTWAHWAHTRAAAKRNVAIIRARVANLRTHAAFGHWLALFRQALNARSMLARAALVHKKSAVGKALAKWSYRADYQRREHLVLKQGKADYHGSMLMRVYRAWQRAQVDRRAHFAAGIQRFEQPRLRALYVRWRSLVGRRSAIVNIHAAYLSRTLQTWSTNARDAHRERVWIPRADAANAERLKKVVLGHWFKYRIVHQAWRAFRPRVVKRIKSEVLGHWMELFQLRLAITRFEVATAEASIRRKRLKAVRAWRGRIVSARELDAREQAFTGFMLGRVLGRAYARWRESRRELLVRAARSDAAFQVGPCRRLQYIAYRGWRERFLELVASHSVQLRGAAHETSATNPRKLQGGFDHWLQVASYSARVHKTARLLVNTREHTYVLKVFHIWHGAFRRAVGARRMQRLKAAFVARQAVDMWRAAVDMGRRFDAAAAKHRAAVKREHLQAWWARMKARARTRVAVELLQARMRAKVLGRTGPGWLRVREALVPRLKQYLEPSSCIAFYMRVWRAYLAQCRAYRDTNDQAALHYERKVLLPSTWREWKETNIESQLAGRARDCRLRWVKKRIMSNLAKMLQRKFARIKATMRADEMSRRHLASNAMDAWKAETKRVQAERAAMELACQTKFFGLWFSKARFQVESRRKLALAEDHHAAQLVRSTHAHWRSYYAHLRELHERAVVFDRKVEAWGLARLFGAWLDRLRRRQWRQQRTHLILHAVRTIWQKNAFIAWHHHVLGVAQQRRAFLLSRVLYAWKFLSKRARSRRAESAEDHRVMQQMENARVSSMPQDLRDAHLHMTPRRLEQRRARSEERSQPRPSASFRSTSVSSPVRHTPGGGLSAADLDDVASPARSARTRDEEELDTFASHLTPPTFFQPPSTPSPDAASLRRSAMRRSFSPSATAVSVLSPLRRSAVRALPPPSPFSPTASMKPLPLMKMIDLPRLTIADQQWRMTPIRPDEVGVTDPRLGFSGTIANGSVTGSPPRPSRELLSRAGATGSPSLASQLEPFETSECGILAASIGRSPSVSPSASIGRPRLASSSSRAATAAPVVVASPPRLAHAPSPTHGVSASLNGSIGSALSPPRPVRLSSPTVSSPFGYTSPTLSRARRRQEERQQASERKQEIAAQLRSPASRTFVAKLFQD